MSRNDRGPVAAGPQQNSLPSAEGASTLTGSLKDLEDLAKIRGVFGRYVGRRLLGIIEAGGCTELVFEGGQDNLLCLFSEDGTYEHGSVEDPASYVVSCEQWTR